MSRGRITKGMKHGLSGYDWHGCRCEVCKAAKSRFHKEYRTKYREVERDRSVLRKVQLGRGGKWSHHGTEAKYRTACRCARCRQAHYRYVMLVTRKGMK